MDTCDLSPKPYLGIMQLDRVCCPKTGQTKLSGEDREERVTFTSRVLHQEDVTAMEKLEHCTFDHGMEFCC